MNLYSALNI